MTKRYRARILTMQSLCQYEALGGDFILQLDDFLAEENAPDDVQAHARDLFNSIIAQMEEIDKVIDSSSDNWHIKRMAVVDRNILRVATYELLFKADVPRKAAIDQAVELGKEFGTRESPSFINGVLDAIVKKHPVAGGTSSSTPPVTQ